MPFRQAAKVRTGLRRPRRAGRHLWNEMPCYSYVTYRTGRENSGRHRATSTPLAAGSAAAGPRRLPGVRRQGKGKFVGWNVTIRRPGGAAIPWTRTRSSPSTARRHASIEFQGLEDSFGFSWGFPESRQHVPMTGYFRFFKGAAAYRFFVQDAISFQRSLRVTIGFGVHEDPSFRRTFAHLGASSN